MHARELRAMADRCRELERTAEKDDTREQLLHWACEFDNAADADEQQIRSYPFKDD